MNNKESLHAVSSSNRQEIHKEINSMTVEKIDRSIYSKSKDEKKRLHKMKIAWKIRIANGYRTETHILAG